MPKVDERIGLCYSDPMEFKEFLVFRHGETDWNLIKRLQGHSNIPLNEKGREQARVLQKLLSYYRPEVILSSDLSRALETAEIANQDLQCSIQSTAALRECHMGHSEGMFRETLLERFGQQSWDRWLSSKAEDQDFAFPGGESKIEHLRRMLDFVERYVQENSHLQRVAISTHGGSLYRLIQNCRNAPKSSLTVPNCALFRFQLDIQSREWTFLEQVQVNEPALTQPVS